MSESGTAPSVQVSYAPWAWPLMADWMTQVTSLLAELAKENGKQVSAESLHETADEMGIK